ncbi:uncharacterized protein DS421_12g358080 [Arachis hypogaea]|nr:uncharacterized protein DS421_12g358080 [Arachis hypogaea]
MQQLPPGPAFDLGRDHYKRLTGAQNHDWREIYSQWVNRWRSGRYNTLQLGEEIIDFHPLSVYYEWYTQQYGIHLRLSDRVAGEEVGADEPQQQQKEPADSQQQVPPHEQQFQFRHMSTTIRSRHMSTGIRCRHMPPQEGPATSQQSSGHRATSGHASDFDFDQSRGHVDSPGPFATPRSQLFDLNEYP